MRCVKLILISFLATANAAPGALRRNNEAPEMKTLDVIELEDDCGSVEFLDAGDAIVIAGNGTKCGSQTENFTKSVQDLGPLKFYELLSGKSAPTKLVQAQTRVNEMGQEKGSLPPPPDEEDEGKSLKLFDETEEDHQVGEQRNAGGQSKSYACVWYYRRTGNSYWWTGCYGLGGRIEPYRGSLGVAVDWWNGYSWSLITSRWASSYGWAWAYSSGAYAYRRVRTYYAYGDGYHWKVCVD